MKTKIEHFALGLILAPLAPIAGLLGFWWTSYALLPERWISFCAISGLALGILADIFILKKPIARAYQFGMIFWTAITSAILALSEATLPAQLEGMLALPFMVTWGMIWGIILVGGAGLLAVNWLLTGLAVRFTHRFLSTP